MFSLDSSVAVEILRSKGSEQARSRFLSALENGEELYLSSVVIHELMTGALKARRATHHMQRLDALVARLQVAEFTADDAIGAARVRTDLEGAGRTIGALDILIAGQAIARGWTLVTSDSNHMRRVSGLKIVDWTKPIPLRPQSEENL